MTHGHERRRVEHEPDAVCADATAAGLGRRVTLDDIALAVGCDNSALVSSRALSLTSIDRAPRRVASLAVEAAMARASGSTDAPTRQRVDTQLVVHASTG